MNGFNDLTNGEAELFAVLAEECGETTQAVAKILRHGKHSWNPEVVGKRSNIEDLENEVGDILAVVEIMVRVRILDMTNIQSLKAAKLERIFKYLHHQDWKKEWVG